MKTQIIGGDPATQKAVADKLAGRGFPAETTAAAGKTVEEVLSDISRDEVLARAWRLADGRTL